MNKRKLLLAYIRKDDYAHAGEAEGIELAIQHLSKNPNQHILDVGCGLGGTAHYLDKQGWGKVSGIDIDPEVIQYAKLHYPQVYFHCSDAVSLPLVFKNQKFNIITSFNAFFCFSSQKESLKAMADVAEENATLVLFDYSTLDLYNLDNPFCDRYQGSNAANFFYPICLPKIKSELQQTGWQLTKTIDLSKDYENWYQRLIVQMKEKKAELQSLFGEETFEDLYSGYCRLLEKINQKILGGVVIQAKYERP